MVSRQPKKFPVLNKFIKLLPPSTPDSSIVLSPSREFK
jgi:hypothetical protein